MNLRPHRFTRSVQMLLSAACIIGLVLSSISPAVGASPSLSAYIAPSAGLEIALAQEPAPGQPDPNAPPTYIPTYEPFPEPLPAQIDAFVPPTTPGEPVVDMASSEAGKPGVVAGVASASLDPTDGSAPLGDLQMQVAVASGALVQPAVVAVEVLPVATAQQWSPVGMAFRLHMESTPDAANAAVIQTPLTITIDYNQIPLLYGGSFAERLTLYHVVPCAEALDTLLAADEGAGAALTADPTCTTLQALPSWSDATRRVLTAQLTPSTPVGSKAATTEPALPVSTTLPLQLYLPTVSSAQQQDTVTPLPPDDDLYVVAASASSNQGNYAATPFATVSDYQVSLATGSFQTSYPLPVPPAPAGATPDLALRYDSGGVDGMSVNKNNQPGWVGIGWNLDTGYITRHLKTCGLTYAPGDLCLTGDNYSIVLNGVASHLVKDNVTANLYHLQNDPHWKVEQLVSTNPNHPDTHKEYWQVTTPDGVKYRFGGEFDVESAADQNSVYYATVYDADNAVCGTYPYDICSKAWQWNLDRSEDTNGNVTKFFYELETNFYAARTYTAADPTWRKEYVRAGNLARIEYGHRSSANTPTARVQFVMEERCEGACAWPTNYPDTPGDLTCLATGSCTQTAPTFWSRKRLNYVQTQYYNQTTSQWVNVARFDLDFAFPAPPNDPQGDVSEKKLWLNSITQRLGDGTGGLPPASYGYTWLDNRADAGVVGVPPLKMPRINTLTTQLGGTVSLLYFQSHPCNTGNTSNIRRADDCGVSYYSNGGGGYGYFNRWKVQQMTVADTFSGNASQVTTYAYSAPTWHYADDPAAPAGIYLWNDFRGSETVTVTTASGAKTEHRFHRGMNDDRLNTSGGSFSAVTTLSDGTTRADDNWLRGNEVETRVLTSASVVLQRAVNWFTSVGTAGSGRTGAYFVAPQQQEETLTATPSVTTRVAYTYDTYGNTTLEVRYGDIATSVDDRTIQREFYANLSAWIVNALHWEMLWPGTAPGTNLYEKSLTVLEYDALGWDQIPSKGNVSRIRRFAQILDGATPSYVFYDTTRTYDVSGRILTEKDGRDKTTTTAYHPFYGYAVSVTNALSHATQFVNDPGWGVPTLVTDPNAHSTTLQYDGYGRLTKVWKPTEPTGGSASLEFVYSPATRPASVKTRTLLSGSSYVESWQYVDGFGRALQTQTPLADGTRAVTHQSYDALGQLQYQSAPYAAAGAAGSSFSVPVWSTTASYTQSYYDDFSRPVKTETRSQGNLLWAASTSYQGLMQTQTDANGNVTKSRNDAFGQVASVTELIGATSGAATPYTTTYTYDLQGNLTQVSDAQSHVTTMSYDLMGRKLSMTDPDMGSWLYQYDANGNLTGQRDALNQWLYMEYDALNRLTIKRKTTALTGPKVAEYQYDATGQKGLLSKSLAYDSAGTVVTTEVRASTYDVDNRLTQQQWVVAGGGTFRFDYAYNAADARTSLTYPGGNAGTQGEAVAFGYNTVGQLTSVVGSGVSYLSSATYNAQGQPAKHVNDVSPNGLTRLFTYETNTLRLWTVKAGTNSTAFDNQQSLAYKYDNVSNVTAITDTVNAGQVQCFGYDTRSRLTSARTAATYATCATYAAVGVGPYNHAYAYSVIGNITSSNGNAYVYGSAKPHAVTTAYGNTYAYDANGNQTSRTIGGVVYTLVYDIENRLVEVKQGVTSLATFVYDADGQRVKGTVGGVTTLYLDEIYEYVVGSGATTKYYEGNALRRTGYASDNGVFYLLQDHLHSSSALLTQAGALATGGRAYYLPFGTTRGGQVTLTQKRFTGQYHEMGLTDSFGLYDYGARWYDPRLLQFVSPDSLIPNPANPQDLNRYSYVRNNPLRYTDPSGHQACGTWWGGCGPTNWGDIWRAIVAAASATASIVGVPVVAAVGGGAAFVGVGAYGFANTTSSIPTYPPPTRAGNFSIPNPGFPIDGTVSSPVGVPLQQYLPQTLSTPVVRLPSYREFIPTQRRNSAPYLAASGHEWIGNNPNEHQDNGQWISATDLPGGRQAAEALYRLMGGKIPSTYDHTQMNPLAGMAKGTDYEAYFRPWSSSGSPAIEIKSTNVDGTIFREKIHFP